jgi:hypothetical protein
MSEKAFLVLEPFGPDFHLPDTPKNHTYLSVVISRYQQVSNVATELTSAGWVTEVLQEGAGIVVICYPPEPVETAIELAVLLDQAIRGGVGDLGFIDVESDVDVNFNEAEFDVCDEENCCNSGCGLVLDDFEDDFEDDFLDDDLDDAPMMPPEMAESLAGLTINHVHLVDDYRVVFDLDDGRKLVYDDDAFGFHMVDNDG